MKVNIFCCLLACVLGCDVTAGLTCKAVKEKERIVLPVPHSVTGEVKWSRESEGRKVNILTADGDRTTRHINDSGKRYNSQANRSLFILKVAVSDSGRYFSNDEVAAWLTVIPSGTKILSAAVRSNITLKCPAHGFGPQNPTWIRQICGENVTVFSQSQKEQHAQYSPEEKELILTGIQLSDSGLYVCAGKPAAYVNVTKGPNETSEKGAPQLVLVLGVAIPLIIIVFVILFITWACRYKRRERKEENVYAEIPNPLMNEAQQGGSYRDDTYSIINCPPALQSQTGPYV